MQMTYKVGTLFGIQVRLHIALVIIFALGAIQWYPKHGVAGALFGMLLVGILLACILLHEFGHSLVAKHFKIPVRDIMLWPLGGIATLEKKPANPRQGLLISIAGPAVNVVLSIIFFAIMSVVLQTSDLKALSDNLTPSWQSLLVILCINNLFLAVFNLIPAYPMDGGQILLHGLSLKIDPSKAMHISAWVARILAMVLGTYAIYHFWFMAAAICVFVFIGAPTRKVTRDEIYG